MRKTLFATAIAAAALIGAPAFAQVTGYVGAQGSRSEVDFFGVDTDADSYGLHGAVSVPLSETFSAQFSAGYNDSENSDGGLQGEAHLVSSFDGVRLGGFVGAAEIVDETAVTIGVEGQVDHGDLSFDGALVYGVVDAIDVEAWSTNVNARYFATDNTRLDVRVGRITFDTAIGDDNAWALGLGGEHQFGQGVSLFGGYDYYDFEDTDIIANVFTIGVRYNFGGGTLRTRNSSGANFDGATRLLSTLSF